jgi:DNA-binding CsgD family transcriptional regulator
VLRPTSLSKSASLLPAALTHSEILDHFQTEFRWTPCQARVVLAGVSLATYEEIGEALGMAPRTVRAHYCAVYMKAGLPNRTIVTSFAVASVWRLAVLNSCVCHGRGLWLGVSD